MAKKTARVYTLDELKEKSRKALDDPKLVEIVKSALQNKDGKVNCTWAYKEAEKYVHDQTKDLQKTKELAVATRFLAMLRRDFGEDFKALITQEKSRDQEIKPVEKGQRFDEIEFHLPLDATGGDRVELIVRETGCPPQRKFTLRFRSDNDYEQDIRSAGPCNLARIFCMQILNSLVETTGYPAEKTDKKNLLLDLIQLLEGKLGLKVKVCGNCRKYVCDEQNTGRCFNRVPDGYPGEIVCFSDTCEKDWTPKEVSEKNEN